MIQRSLEDLDDAAFDTARFDIIDGVFMAWGHVVEPRSRFRMGTFVVRLAVEDAVGFIVEDDAGTGDLILESVEVTPAQVTLIGVIPCVVRIATRRESTVALYVAESPLLDRDAR